ncbi:MAG TPA: response regulator transcription factor [Puia sp.]|jgi:DNA-binding NarL/FixJ family response regulator|nr:response regulator transcription factor [Puia sp.]
MLRILIADDHEVVRQGLEKILRSKYPDARITTVINGEELISKVHGEEWDLVISDLSMPSIGGLDALPRVRERQPDLPVLILTMHPEEQYALQALKAGASGYLTKDMDSAELLAATRHVLSGRKYITPSIAERLMENANSDTTVLPHQKLSSREFEVFIQLAGGTPLIEISRSLSLTPTTVSTYRSRILQKLNLTTNADLTRYAIRHRLIAG